MAVSGRADLLHIGQHAQERIDLLAAHVLGWRTPCQLWMGVPGIKSLSGRKCFRAKRSPHIHMKTIKNQTLAATRLDSQGERKNTKEALESFAALYAGRRMPLNQQHDLSLNSPGYVENVCVIPDAGSPGDWSLVGDVYFDGDALEIPVGGFSISFLEVLRKGNTQDIINVYLPYPYYNDSTLIDEVFEEGFISVGRWAKKAADPTLIVSVHPIHLP